MLSVERESQVAAFALALANFEEDPQQVTQQFEAIQGSIDAESSLGVQINQLLWEELLRTRRSLSFWRSLGEAEGELSKALSNQHIRLQQNYLRLMQEQ